MLARTCSSLSNDAFEEFVKETGTAGVGVNLFMVSSRSGSGLESAGAGSIVSCPINVEF